MTTTEDRTLTPTVFTCDGAPVLSDGNIQNLLAKAPALWAHVKVYATGGENGLHAHPNEDHMFFVLAGEATFTEPSGRKTVIGPYGGIMLPRGNSYAFQSSGTRNLILLRVGTTTDTAFLDSGPSETHPEQGKPKAVMLRTTPEGVPHDGSTDPANKTGAIPGVVVPGASFQAPSLR